MVSLSRRRVVRAGATSMGAVALGGTLPLLRGWYEERPQLPAGTTLESTLDLGGGHGYRRIRVGAGERARVRQDLAIARRGREDRRRGVATLVQVSDLHVTDVQHPLRFEYVDRINGVGHRPQEMLGVHGTAALVDRINGLAGGPWTGRPVDAVVSTGDNTDNQSHNELQWLLGVLAGGLVTPDSGTGDGFEGVASSGLREYWQPDSGSRDAYKDRGFPEIPGLLEAARQSFIAPGLNVPWVLTMGNHDTVCGGMLGNRGYVYEWSGGTRKIFSAHDDTTVHLAKLLKTVRAGDDVAEMLTTISRSGTTRTVHPDPLRMPFSGEEYVRMLHQPRYVGAGPVGHGYDADAGANRLFFSYETGEDMLVISLDTTNQAGGATGSIGQAQRAWLRRELDAHPEHYVVVLSHHPSTAMDNTAPDPRDPGERRYDGGDLVAMLHEHPQVVAWVNGHTHRNRITAHRHYDPRRSFWELNTASHVDAPQQARIIEVVRNGDGTVSLMTTMLDADSPVRSDYEDLSRTGLASIYREVAFNDSRGSDRHGSTWDRNAELVLVDPL